jgi:GT2 family glycosyltransferase
MSETALSVIVVNYNGGRIVRECLDRLWQELRPEWQVLAVDNASRDGSADGLEDAYPGLSVIRNADNLGFARANNQAMRVARGAYVLLLNPDVSIQPSAISRAIAYLDEHPDVAILGPKILLADGRPDPAARRSFKTPETYLFKMTGLSRLFPRHPRFGRYYLSYLDDDDVTDVDSIVGAFMLVRRSVIDAIGMLDERFFMYCEDEDWCWRAKQAGGRVVYHPGIVVHHRKGSSSRTVPLRMAYHFHRSLFLYHRKNIAPRYSMLTNAGVYAGIAASFAARSSMIALRRALPRVA